MAESRPQVTFSLPGYELLREIGRGGVSTVYLARHQLLGREVAIKVMAPALTVEEGFNRRFIREGQTIARLEHPGIVTVYDVSVEDYRPYIAMEYLPGGSLKDRMKKPIPPDDALWVLREIADSLGYAHDCGVFHRDVKPENILFRHNGQPVLTDFGIAKSDSQDTALTSVGVVVGTPRYISPEQAQGHGCDARSDIYALGVILFEMLVGQPPFDVKGSMSLLYAHINDPIPRLPDNLGMYQGLIDDLMAKDPDLRIPDCGTLVERLDALARGEVSSSATRQTPLPSSQRIGTPAWYRRSGPRLFALSSIAVVLLAYLLWSQNYLGGFGIGSGSGDDLKTEVDQLMTQDESAPDETPPADSAAQGEPEDEPDVEELFRQAQMLYTGAGGEADREAAMDLYRRAASGGHAPSQFVLGLAYGNGEGVGRDERRAVVWLTRAADAGLRDAQYNLVLGKIFGPAPDPGAAARIARKLAGEGYTPVYRILGWMYNTGTGVDSSFFQSVHWNFKTMIGDWRGKSRGPNRVVHRWERRLQDEIAKIWDSKPLEGN